MKKLRLTLVLPLSIIALAVFRVRWYVQVGYRITDAGYRIQDIGRRLMSVILSPES